MPRFYRNETELKYINTATGKSDKRLSDARRSLHSANGLSNSRGGNYDQIQYMRIQSGDADGVNEKKSDSWVMLEGTLGGGNSGLKRWKQNRDIVEVSGFQP